MTTRNELEQHVRDALAGETEDLGFDRDVYEDYLLLIQELREARGVIIDLEQELDAQPPGEVGK